MSACSMQTVSHFMQETWASLGYGIWEGALEATPLLQNIKE